MNFVDASHRLAQLSLVGLLMAAMAFSQSDTAPLNGLITDATGSVIAGAQVTATNERTGVARTATSNEAGNYVVSNLPPGTYTIAVESPGFKRYVKTAIKLDASLPTTADAQLELGAVTETIEVVANAATVQAETATVGRTVEERQIKNLMLNGRNAIRLALLKPGVRSNSSLSSFTFGLDSGGYSINGSRTQDNLITTDGAVAVRTRANGTSIGVADIDTLQEIQILTANYNAEYGRSNGGQIRYVTRSGGQDFHGTAYEYFRNDALDANEWRRNRANQDRQALRYNQLGYNFSGPVYIPGKWNRNKDKLFFLWAQEWVRFREEVSNTITVPTLAMRNGDFSELLTANPFLKPVQLVNPQTGQPIPNNVIPQSLLSQNGLGLLRAYPEPTPGFQLGANNLFQSAPQPQNQRKDTVSIDFNPLLSHSFRFRFQNYNYDVVNPFTGNTDRAPRIFERPNQTVSLNYVYTISPTTVNEFLATASVDRVKIGIVTEGNKFDRTQYGINYPYIFPERKEIQNKIPTVDINGFQRLDGGPYPASSSGPIYNIANNTTKILGNHTLKFGFLYDRQGQNDFDQINVTGVPGGTNNQNGRFIFTDNRAGGSGLAIANAAMGLFSTYAEIGQRAYTPYRSQGFESFIQDSWRVNSRLKLELGLRHTMVTPYYYSLWRNMAVFDPDRYDPARAAVLDPKTGNVLAGDRFNGVVIPGDGWPDAAFGRVAIADSGEFNHLFDGKDKYWGEFQPWNFQPRVGLAYQINSKTVFRAGAGRFFARPGVADNIFLGGNPPFQPMVSLSNGSVDNPGGGARTAFPQFFMTSDPVFKIPSAWNWNVTVEREIGFSTKVEVAYVGRIGLHLERVRELNALQPGTTQQPQNQGLDTNFLRPYKGFAFINLGENAGRSEYNSLQLSAERRFAKGLSFGVAYTLSESFDDTSTRRNALVNPFDASLNWGHSEYDTRHVAVVNFIYELPFFRNNDLSGKLLGGWQITGVIQGQTGRPFWVGRDNDYAGIGVPGFQPWESNGPLESGIGGFSQGVGDDTFWFRTQVGGNPIFTQPAAGTFAYSQPRHALYNPGIQSWNAALFKDFRITEQQTLQFRSEFFNFPNHPNLDGANTDPNSSVFGKVTSKTTDRRQIQLSLRYAF